MGHSQGLPWRRRSSSALALPNTISTRQPVISHQRGAAGHVLHVLVHLGGLVVARGANGVPRLGARLLPFLIGGGLDAVFCRQPALLPTSSIAVRDIFERVEPARLPRSPLQPTRYSRPAVMTR